MSETRTPRKVIQIAVTSSGGHDHLFALTDDGSVWMLSVDGGGFGWREIPPPPDKVTEIEDENPRPRSR